MVRSKLFLTYSSRLGRGTIVGSGLSSTTVNKRNLFGLNLSNNKVITLRSCMPERRLVRVRLRGSRLGVSKGVTVT